MTASDAAPTTLLGLFHAAPADQIALIQPESNVRVTYGALRQQVEGLADALAAAGVSRGDRVGIALPNGIPAVVTFLAASMAGTAAPLNPAYKEDEFRFYLEDTNARLLLVPPDGADDARRAAGDKVRVLAVEMDAAGTVTVSGNGRGRAADAPGADDVALILHTSGSTGRPKRVPLKHANLSISARNVAQSYALTPNDVSLCVMPLFHVHGLVASTLATLATGGTVVVPAKFNPLSFWRVVRDHGATWYSAVPTIHQILLARADAASGPPPGAERLRFIRSCSAPLLPPVMHGLEAAFGAPVLEAYGMTEAAHQMASNPLPPRARKPGSVGVAAGPEVAIMDAGGALLAAGETGEVVIRGANVTAGYLANPSANAQAFTAGWLRTGDQGFLDEDGYLRLTGRLKELINRGGEKISPREVDEALLDHPAVAQAVTFALPDEKLGEEVAAAIVLREGAASSEHELREFARGRLAPFKVPRRIVFVPEIPKGATGKLQRIGLAEKLGLV